MDFFSIVFRTSFVFFGVGGMDFFLQFLIYGMEFGVFDIVFQQSFFSDMFFRIFSQIFFMGTLGSLFSVFRTERPRDFSD